MRAMSIFARLLSTPAITHAALGIERSDIMETLRRASTHDLARISSGRLAEDLRDAVDQGRDILQIGCAPADVRIHPDGGDLIAHVRLEDERTLRTLAISFDAGGRITSAAETHARIIEPATAL